LLHAADFNARTSALVQERRFEFLLAIYDSPNLITCPYKIPRAALLFGRANCLLSRFFLQPHTIRRSSADDERSHSAVALWGDATRPVVWKIDIGYQLIDQEQTSVVGLGGTASAVEQKDQPAY
jgi:hypothetical protein